MTRISAYFAGFAEYWPASMVPDSDSVLTARQAGRPPRAAIFRSMICCSGKIGSNGPAVNETPSASTPARAIAFFSNMRIL